MILCDWFPPAFKAGGPIQSVYNLAQSLSNYYEISVLTSAFDMDGTNTITPEDQNQWLTQAKLKVRYSNSFKDISSELSQLISKHEIDIMLINSMFSLDFAIMPLYKLWSAKWPIKVLLAPRGMLKPSALAFKPWKKKLFLTIMKYLAWHKKIGFLATDKNEEKDIKAVFGQHTKCYMLPPIGKAPDPVLHHIQKIPGELKLLFLGRIHPIKGLDLLLKELQGFENDKIFLSIVGTPEDAKYHDFCTNLTHQLPPNIEVVWVGGIPFHEIHSIILAHHALILPTQGENFGQAVWEHFAAGRPVIISDQTPWRALQAKGAGWDLSLQKPQAFVEAIHEMAAMDQDSFDIMCQNAHDVANNYIEEHDFKSLYNSLFALNS